MAETVASRVELPAWVDKQAQTNLGLANEIAARPYQTYSGPRLAGRTADQTTAANAVRSGMGQGQDSISAALKALGGVSGSSAPRIGAANQNPPTVDRMQAARGGSIGAGHVAGRPAVASMGYGATGAPAGGSALMAPGEMPFDLEAMLKQMNGAVPMAGDQYPGGGGYQPPANQGGDATPQMKVSTVDPAELERVNAERVAAERIGAERIGAEKFTDADLTAYMNQYRQAALDPTLTEIGRQGERMLTGNAARATGSGAFGGSRHALLDAETQKNVLSQLAKTEAEGMAAGFDTSAGLVLADQARALEAAKANQGTGLEAAKANQSTGLQAGMANQDATLKAALANQNVTTDARFRNMDATNAGARTNAELTQQTNLANQEAALRKMGLDITSAGQQGELARLAQQMNYTDINALEGIGAAERADEQANLDLAYGDFLKEQNFSAENLNMLISALNQTPYARTTYGPGANTGAQVAGGAASLMALLAKMFG